MKLKIVGIVAVLLFGSLASKAQEAYKVSYDDNGNKVVTGEMTMKMLANDSAFSWFYTGVNHYQPAANLVKYISAYRDSFDVVVFAGTWSPETRVLLPAFYRVMMASSYPVSKIHLYGVDHDNKTLGNETQQYHVDKTPAIIILRKGNEVGRIVESPQRSVEADVVGILDKMMAEVQAGNAKQKM